MHELQTHYIKKLYQDILDHNINLNFPNGWFLLVNNMLLIINKYLKSNNLFFTINNIDSRFGSLVVNYLGGNDYIKGVIDSIELMSRSTCEQCGNVGQLNNHVILETLCSLHGYPPNDKPLLKGEIISVLINRGFKSVVINELLSDCLYICHDVLDVSIIYQVRKIVFDNFIFFDAELI